MAGRKQPVIHLLADGNNERGDLFTRLMTKVLDEHGYQIIGCNVHSTGYEIDIQAKAKFGNQPLYAECKAHAQPVSGEVISKFYGVYADRYDKDKTCSGMIFSLSGFNGPARAYYEEKPPEVKERFKLSDGTDILRLLQTRKLICSEDLVVDRMKREVPNLQTARAELAYGEHGLVWLVILADQGKETHFTFLNATGDRLHADIVGDFAKYLPGLAALAPLSCGPSIDLEAQKTAYLQRLADAFEWVDMGGLAPQAGPELLRVRLDDIYTNLQVQCDVPILESFVRSDFDIRRRLVERGASPLDILQELEMVSLQSSSRTSGESSSPHTTIPATNVVKGRRVVVLGDPGSGKSTLLRHIARSVALGREIAGLERPLLPVYVRVAEYDDYCTKHAAVPLADFVPVGANVREIPLSRELLESHLKAGHCLFLLDGLDEIVDPGRRRQIRDRIQDLSDTCGECHVIVTSRIVGYREVQLLQGPDDFEQFTLCPFDDEAIKAFSKRWYEAIGQSGAIVDPTRQNAGMLAGGILATASVRYLASNPLLMTLIALIYWREVRLPRRRIELYRSACQMLLSKWVQTRTPDVVISEREALTLLMAIAFHIHSTSSSGLISKPELERLLTAQLIDPARSGLSEMEAGNKIEEFLRIVPQHVGLLYSKGYDDHGCEVFGFLHLTFEEYLTGRELARRWRQKQLDLPQYLHLPRWQEPILLACAHLSDEDDEDTSNRFVEEIFSASSPYEDLCHRDLVLAARCIGDDARVLPGLRNRILQKLDEVFPSRLWPLNRAFGEVLHDIAASTSAVLAKNLILRKYDSEDAYVRRVAIEVLLLLTVHATDTWILEVLLKASRDPASHVRSSALLGLGSTCSHADDPRVLQALTGALDDPEWAVRGFGVLALSRPASWTKETAMAAAFRALDDTEDLVRTFAIMILGRRGDLVVELHQLGAVIGGLEDESFLVRHQTAEVLGQIGGGRFEPSILAALLKALGDANDQVRKGAASALALIGRGPGEVYVLPALFNALADPAENTRVASASALAEMGGDSPTLQLLEGLLRGLGDPNANTRTSATLALGQLRPPVSDSRVVSGVLNALKDPDANVRNSAAIALGQIGQKHAKPDVVEELLSALTDPDANVRSSAASALGQIGPAANRPCVVEGLFRALDDPELGVRGSAALALGQLSSDVAEPRVVQALAKLLKDPQWAVRGFAAEALGEMGEHTVKLGGLDALLEALTDPEEFVRVSAVSALGQMGTSAATSRAVEALVNVLTDPEVGVQTASALALGRMGEHVAKPQVIEALAKALEASQYASRESLAEALVAVAVHAPDGQILETLAHMASEASDDIEGSLSNVACSALLRLLPYVRTGNVT
ncbi:MAG: NACHT domain-containing protein [Phycisphaerae bacterium]|nr:NACHT domain-containing protein [Phycisphaerae bacterium]